MAELSPAAQAVMAAAVTAYDDEHLYTLPMTKHAGAVAAAALRAAARYCKRDPLLPDLANELEGLPND